MEILFSIKSRTDAVICPTTSGNPTMTLEERMRILPPFKFKMATLNIGTMNYAMHFVVESYDRRGKTFREKCEPEYLLNSKDVIFRNTFSDLECVIQTMVGNDVKPECELYDLGMLFNTAFLVNRGMLKKPYQIQFVLGVLGKAAVELDKNPDRLALMPYYHRWEKLLLINLT
jgi:uncharacterized protein (DUF849 family)